MEALNILYVGEAQHSRLHAALERDLAQVNVMTPETLHEALAMYVLYFPDVIVFEGCSELVREVFYHLSSGVTQFTPQQVESMVIVADGERWHAPQNTILKQIPANSDFNALVWAIEDVRAQSEAQIVAAHQREMA
ncbi:MAG: hypothetical protein U0694_03255 [Anaerolineae bacterium]